MINDITESVIESAKIRLKGLEKEAEFLDQMYLEFGSEEDLEDFLEVERMIGEGYSLVAYYTYI